MAKFTGTVEDDTADASNGTLIGFTGGTIAELQDSVGDVFMGGGGSDFIWAGDGADQIDGGPGNDFMYGGAGDDLLIFDNQDTNVLGGPGFDFATAYDSAGPINVGTFAQGIEGVYGSRFDDTIDSRGNPAGGSYYGSDGDDTIYGAIGNIYAIDYINGGAGNDIIHIDYNDTVIGGDGWDYITAASTPKQNGAMLQINVGDAGVEGVYGTVNNDIINASTAPVGGSYWGYDGDDRIKSSPYGDIIHGGNDFDEVWYQGPESDYVYTQLDADSWQVTNVVTHVVDNLTSIEILHFSTGYHVL